MCACLGRLPWHPFPQVGWCAPFLGGRGGGRGTSPLSDTRTRRWGEKEEVVEGTLGSRSGGWERSPASSMAGSLEAAVPPHAPPGRQFSFASTRRRCCHRRPGMPALPGLLSLGLLLSRVCCAALAGPIVDPHVRAVWGKNVTLKCIIDINETLTQITWEKIHGKSAHTVAVHHPDYGFSVQGEYQGRVSLKNTSLTDASIILTNVTFSDSGEYVCKAATFPLGNAQSSTTVAVLGMLVLCLFC
ncbi:Nectin-3 [Varanus komodoensis]|nr:Nectin-3 [Varanus komodoensis]